MTSVYDRPKDQIFTMATTPPEKPPVPPTEPVRETGVSLATRPQRLATKPPSLYQVVLLNDDFTPMEFVVLVLQEFFNKDRETATSIMLKVHMEGRGVCGVYTHDVAHTKAEQVLEAARSSGHPLQCVCEPVE